MEELHGGGAGVVAVIEPALDAGAVVGDAGAEANRGFHDVERYRTPEEARHRDVEVVVPHHLCRRSLYSSLSEFWVARE